MTSMYLLKNLYKYCVHERPEKQALSCSWHKVNADFSNRILHKIRGCFIIEKYDAKWETRLTTEAHAPVARFVIL